ncbi:hypothetical protein ACFWBH_36575 [Streptomyces sp. NPDC059999]
MRADTLGQTPVQAGLPVMADSGAPLLTPQMRLSSTRYAEMA